jgi:hypothetical protein
MRTITTRVFLGLFALMVSALPSDGTAADRGRGCRGGERLRIQDLDVSPDPLVQGQRIRSWRVRVQLNSDRECETEIVVREGNDIVGRARNYNLRPGMNDVEIQPVETYRFQGNEHCFEVVVDLEGSRRRLDADRRFCAKQIPAWSMRERDDQRRGSLR